MHSVYLACWVAVNWDIQASYSLLKGIARYQITEVCLSQAPRAVPISRGFNQSSAQKIKSTCCCHSRWNRYSRCHIHTCWDCLMKGYSWRSLEIVPRVSGSETCVESIINWSNWLYLSRCPQKQWHWYDSWVTPQDYGTSHEELWASNARRYV